MLRLPDEFTMPQCLLDVEEVSACYEIATFLYEKYLAEIFKIEREIHSDTAQSFGLEHFEKMLGIVPGESDTIAERQFRVQVIETVIDVLSFDRLERLVEKIGGEGSSVFYDKETKTLTVKCALTSQKMFSILKKTVEDFVPVDVKTNCILLFNSFSLFKNKTFAQMKNKTFTQIKSEVL